MAPKHSLDARLSSSSAKRAHSIRTTTPTVKPSYRANFDKLCALHNWVPLETVRDKLAALLQLSGNRLEASELLPLAFVQHSPFIWVKGFLLLGYNDTNNSVWYKAYPTGRGIARGRYYNSAQVGIQGKHAVTKFWQPWVDVFDIENRGAHRTQEYFTGVYLILKKFPNLRYKLERSKGDTRDPQNAIRTTGIVEYPFNDAHPFMKTSSESNEVENNEVQESFDADTDTVDDISFIKQEQTGLHDEDRSHLLPRQLLKQLASGASSRESDLVSLSLSQRHIADDRQGLPLKPAKLAPSLRHSSMQLENRAQSRGLDSAYLSRSQEYIADDQPGPNENDNGLTSFPSSLAKEIASRADLRDSMPIFVSDSPAHATEEPPGVQDDTSETFPLSDSSTQPTFRAYLREQVSPSLSRFDKPNADKRAGLHAQKAAPLFLPEQASPKSTSRTSSRQIDWRTFPGRATSSTQIGPNTEDNIAAPIYQQSPKTPTSRGPSLVSQATTSSCFNRTKSQSTHQKIRSNSTREFREYNIRVPIDEPRWSISNFKFAVVSSVSTAPEITRSTDEESPGPSMAGVANQQKIVPFSG
ncbi:hypothetical protein KCU98_g706, partial [Aureobasidium melanogenum]